MLSWRSASWPATCPRGGTRAHRRGPARRDELARLFDLSRDVLMTTEGRDAIDAWRVRSPADSTRSLPSPCRRERLGSVPAGALTRRPRSGQLSQGVRRRADGLEFDAYARTYSGHRTMTAGGQAIRLVPLRVGTRPIGLLAAAGRAIEARHPRCARRRWWRSPSSARSCSKNARPPRLTRQSEELKTALLASLGHDLRTPLTAIRVAASNLRPPAGRRMARAERLIPGRGRAPEPAVREHPRDGAHRRRRGRDRARWTHPSEIVAAARDQVEQALRRSHGRGRHRPRMPVRLDPRLTAAALAHLLENAAQYARRDRRSRSLPVDRRRPDDSGCATTGPASRRPTCRISSIASIAAARRDARTSGTGMGLWIARGLLAVEDGRVWAENCPDGGAPFTIVVPRRPRSRTRARRR